MDRPVHAYEQTSLRVNRSPCTPRHPLLRFHPSFPTKIPTKSFEWKIGELCPVDIPSAI
jgi:hypothetical protein